MIIFNEKEMASKYTVNDDMILDIHTNMTIEELWNALQNGEPLDEEKISINAVLNKEGKIMLEGDSDKENSDYHGYALGRGKVLSAERIDDITDYNIGIDLGRPKIFSAFESFTFGNTPDGYSFKPMLLNINSDQHKEVLRKHLALALGIMPTLYNEKDIPLSELRSMSKDGDNLYRSFGPGCVAKDNPLPTKADIDYYRTLNEYEKRLVSQMRVHPLDFLNFKKAYEESTVKGAVVTNADYERLARGMSVEDTLKEHNKFVTDELIEKVTNTFRNDHPKHFTPRVIPEFTKGILDFHKGSLTDEQIKDAVLGFTQASSGADIFSITGDNGKEKKVKVVETRNPALIALSSQINFAEMPAQLIRMLSVYFTSDNSALLVEKGFVDWIKAHKDDPVSDLARAIDNVGKIDKFELELNSTELLNKAINKGAYGRQKQYEDKYHYKFEDNEMAIKGRHLLIEQGPMKIYILPPDDVRNFIVGDSLYGGVSCCQHFGNAGEACVWHNTTDPFAGNVIIEKHGEILAQAYCWVDVAKDIFVFDNFEFKNDGNADKYMNIIGVFSKNLPYSNVQIGMGYTKGTEWAGLCPFVSNHKNAPQATMPTTKYNRHVYSDYHPQGTSSSSARIIKEVDGRTHRAGLVSAYEKRINENICKVTLPEDEPTRWDTLAQPQFAFMLNDCTKSIEDRIRLAEEFIHNPTKALQAEVFARNPEAILTVENPDPELQVDMWNTHPDIAKQIPNPCVELQALIIESDPNYLRRIPNPSLELASSVLNKNGLLLSAIEHPTRDMCLVAVRNNGYAIKFVPEEFQNEEMKLAAVNQAPKVASLIRNVSPEVQLAAVRRDPSVILLLNEPTIQSQMSAVANSPDLVLRIKNPAEIVVKVAVEHNPSMIRKFQFQYPELREVAINTNPFAAKELAKLTKEEYDLAVRLNPEVERFLINPDERPVSQGFSTTSVMLDEDIEIG